MAERKVKVTVTLDSGVVDRLRGAVAEGRARSVSAYVEHAIVGQLAVEADFDNIVEKMLETSGGPVTEAERRAARQALDPPAA